MVLGRPGVLPVGWECDVSLLRGEGLFYSEDKSVFWLYIVAILVPLAFGLMYVYMALVNTDLEEATWKLWAQSIGCFGLAMLVREIVVRI